jgi:hypothetical protein
MVRRALTTALASSACAALVPATAWGAAQTSAEHLHQETVFVSAADGATIPCIGVDGSAVPADVTLTVNGVRHTTDNSAGAHEFTMFTGQFAAVLLDGSRLSGRVTSANEGNLNAGTGIETATEIWTGRITSGTGAGTSWTNVVHVSSSVDGSFLRHFFDRTTCH